MMSRLQRSVVSTCAAMAKAGKVSTEAVVIPSSTFQVGLEGIAAPRWACSTARSSKVGGMPRHRVGQTF